MTAILYSEINILCISLLLLIYIKIKSRPYMQMGSRVFQWVLLSNCLLFGIDVLWIFADSRSVPIGIAINWCINGLYYVLSAAVSYIWFLFSEQMQSSSLVRKRSGILLSTVPMLLLILLTLTSVKTGWLFYIDSANAYHRGPLYFLQLLLSYGYVIFTALSALLRSGRAAKYEEKKKYRTLASFVVPTLVAGFVQVLLPGVPTLCVGTTFGICYIFLTMQEQMISTDSLTGLNNRNRLMQRLSDRIEHYDGESRLYVLMMDLDYFKQINDRYGHLEGDNALRTTANALKKSSRDERYFIARYGGDEFVAQCELIKGERIEDICQGIHAALKRESEGCPYTLSLSIGYAEYNLSIKTEQELIKLADAALYKVKQAR